jgi:hypothetical protein
VIIPIPFFGLVELEDEDGLEVTNKTAVENNTAVSSSRGSSEGITVETEGNAGA